MLLQLLKSNKKQLKLKALKSVDLSYKLKMVSLKSVYNWPT